MPASGAITNPTTGINLMPHPGLAMHEYIVGELASLGAVVATLMGFLPSVATLFAIIWYSILLHDRLIARRLKGVPAQDLDTDRRPTDE